MLGAHVPSRLARQGLSVSDLVARFAAQILYELFRARGASPGTMGS